MSMQSVASPAIAFTPPKRNSLTHIPGDEGWPIIGKTLRGARRSQGTGRAAGRQIRPGLSQPHLRRDQPRAARARGQRARAVRPGQAVLLDPWLGPDPRPAVSARPDAARFRRAPAAPARAVGRLQVRADEILSGARSIPASRARVAQWKAQPGPMLFYPAMKQLTLDLAATSFLGADIGPEVDEITRAFVDMVAASVAVIRKPLPGTQMARGVRGRKRIVAYFSRTDSDRAAPRAAARTCSRSCARRPTRTARCCRPRTSSTT